MIGVEPFILLQISSNSISPLPSSSDEEGVKERRMQILNNAREKKKEKRISRELVSISAL